jgi:two-component system response regulator VanR
LADSRRGGTEGRRGGRSEDSRGDGSYDSRGGGPEVSAALRRKNADDILDSDRKTVAGAICPEEESCACMKKENKILVVDDEKEIADLIEIYLKNEGYEVAKFYRAAGVLECADSEPIALAVLDLMLPDMDGMELMRRIRQRHFFPIILLTAKNQETDKLNGLTLGADDYMTKPFEPLELVARVKAQLRRSTRYNALCPAGTEELPQEEISIRGLTINADTHKCFLNGAELDLTPLEFDILLFLCRNRGRVISSETLFEQVWGEAFLDNDNTVMAHIARLRGKMKEPPRHPKYVKTIWGVGYTIE